MAQNIQEDYDLDQSKRPRLFTPKSLSSTFQESYRTSSKKLVRSTKNTFIFNLSDHQSLEHYLNTYHQQLNNGTIVRGKRHKGGLHGAVQIISQNGAYFLGIYKHGVRQSGLAKFSTGQEYEGGFLKNQFHGHGQLRYPSGKIVKALWENGVTVGACQITYPQGDVYHGPLMDIKKHGSGSIIFSDGHKYVGQFHHGDITGYGIYLQGQKKIAEGFWQKGVLLYRNNDTNCKVKRMNSKCLPDENVQSHSQQNPKVSIKGIVISLRNFEVQGKNSIFIKKSQTNVLSSITSESELKVESGTKLKSEKKTCCSIAYSND